MNSDEESFEESGESSDAPTEKVEQVKPARRNAHRVKEESKNIDSKINMKFDEKKSYKNQASKDNSLNTLRKMKTVKIEENKENNNSEGDDNSKSQPLNNLTFCITGVTESIARERLEAFLVQLGARVTSAVSGKTSYLVAGAKLEDGRDVTTSTKYSKAKDKKTPILTEDDLEVFLSKELKNEFFTLENFLNWDNQEESKKAQNKEDKASAANIANFGSDNYYKNMLLTDKYRPVTMSDLVGNKGEITSLFEWLKDWNDVHLKGNKKKINPVRGNWQNAPRVNAKAAIISGPPGIGKTSTARILSEQLGYDILEMNASDTRNKKTIQNMIGELSTNNCLDYYTKSKEERESASINRHK